MKRTRSMLKCSNRVLARQAPKKPAQSIANVVHSLIQLNPVSKKALRNHWARAPRHIA